MSRHGIYYSPRPVPCECGCTEACWRGPEGARVYCCGTCWPRIREATPGLRTWDGDPGPIECGCAWRRRACPPSND